MAPWRPMRSLEKPLETHHSRWLCFVLRNLSRSRRNSWSEAPKGVWRKRRAQSVLVHSSPCCGDYKTKWPCRRYINKRKEKRENRIEIFKFLCGATIKKRPPDLNFFFFWDRGLLFSSKNGIIILQEICTNNNRNPFNKMAFIFKGICLLFIWLAFFFPVSFFLFFGIWNNARSAFHSPRSVSTMKQVFFCFPWRCAADVRRRSIHFLFFPRSIPIDGSRTKGLRPWRPTAHKEKQVEQPLMYNGISQYHPHTHTHTQKIKRRGKQISFRFFFFCLFCLEK